MDHVKGVQVDLETKLATVEVEAPNLIDAMNMLPMFVKAITVRLYSRAAGSTQHRQCQLWSAGSPCARVHSLCAAAAMTVPDSVVWLSVCGCSLAT
jgi:hypothetical protein